MDVGTGAAMVHALKYERLVGGGHGHGAAHGPSRLARTMWCENGRRSCRVPLSAARERERGYNQAERAGAARSATRGGCPSGVTSLRRTRDTRSQVRLTPSERAGNVSHAFDGRAIAPGAACAGRMSCWSTTSITTAATLNAAAPALFDGGARIISYVTFGRAPDPGDRTASDFDFDQD